MLANRVTRTAAAVPSRAGVGLKPEHYREVLETAPDIGWFEVHPENYMGAGGPPHYYLEWVRERYPLSLHGVGLSLGGAEPLNRAHLARLKGLIDRYEPGLFSEHLAWSTHEGAYLGDLLPLPYTQETFVHVAGHVAEAQDMLAQRILIENPSTYVGFGHEEMSETEFLAGLAKRTGCGLLLDVNNVHVCAVNHGRSALDYIDAFPMEYVEEIHLAGSATLVDEFGEPFLVDSHDRKVMGDVWQLYTRAISQLGPVPTLIEWDSDIPRWTVLLAEAKRADTVMHNQRANDARSA